MPPTLVLDFDGTVCLGDAPVWCYADEILRHIDDEQAARITTALRSYLDDGIGGYPDGYRAIAELTGALVSQETLHKAYRASRDALARTALDIAAPAGLPEFLATLEDRAHRVLVTNAPATGIPESLQVLGLTGVIDEVRTDAGKPGGFTTLLPVLLAGAAPATLMSVGDFWANDIEPPLTAGCATAYVVRSPLDTRPAHLRAPHLPDLYDAIAAWVTDPATLPTTPQISTTLPRTSAPEDTR
ncbi:HAD family hydrolase [Pseudonocardia sp. GCM10023141]|uniref:HAD family hydrolase n=1 Tax=Pseudonocardia sp. GCM10023141 TaxID=3252653 RepID=UPI0036177B7F